MLAIHIVPRILKTKEPSTSTTSKRGQQSSVSLKDSLSLSSSFSSSTSSSLIIKCHVTMNTRLTIQDILEKISNDDDYDEISHLTRKKRYLCCKIKRYMRVLKCSYACMLVCMYVCMYVFEYTKLLLTNKYLTIGAPLDISSCLAPFQ